ncbi:MAG TPA: SPFH domain-containing protein [Candidatus Acidoferrales bacterium]|nr:SPFH domain-containing protein [Candidatus Acidoferrales bacterium]
MLRTSLDTISFLILLITAAVVFYRFFTRKLRKRVMITDFRRGVYFVAGVLKTVLGPGTYVYNSRKEEISVVDMRPHPILIDRLVFQDALRHEGIISIGASLAVRDAKLAATALREQINDSYLIVRDTVKTAVSQQIAPARENVDALQNSLVDAVNAALGKVGMGISELEITELWAGTPTLRTNFTNAVLQ